MTIKELLEALKGLPEDMPIVLALDQEGNSFSPLEDVEVGVYTGDDDEDSERFGEFTTYANDAGTVEIPKEECNAVCLWPI